MAEAEKSPALMLRETLGSKERSPKKPWSTWHTADLAGGEVIAQNDTCPLVTEVTDIVPGTAGS